MKIMVFGLGSIGKRHARLLKEKFNHEIYAFEIDKNKKKNKLGIKVVYNWSDVKKIKPELAFITNPTFLHIKTAIKCAQLGMNLFIEKPLSNNKKGINKLNKIVKSKELKTYVAYCLRFHPVISWLKKYLKKNKPIHVIINNSSFLPRWRKNINHLKTYSANKNMGGGVILDLSHEIDYLHYLIGDFKNIKSLSKKIGRVTNDSEDFADILLESKKGIFCNIHLNFLSRLKRREVILNFKDHTIVSNLLTSKIVIIQDKKKRIINFDKDIDNIYLSQLNYFFKNIRNKKMMNNIEEASNVFDIIMLIKKEANL